MHFRYLGQVLVKGKKEPVSIYECYEGDPPELMKHKLKTAFEFQAGVEHFLARNFPEAVTAFNSILKSNPEDQPVRWFLNKASRYLTEGVPEDWTGVEVLTFK